MAGSAGDRTEKATPRRRDEARKEGQVARSMEVSSAFAMLAGFAVVALWGPHVWQALAVDAQHWFGDAARVHELNQEDVMGIFVHVMRTVAITTGPFLLVLALVAVLSQVSQVRFRVTPEALKPKFSRINPISGFKQKFSPAALVELAKNVIKIIVVGVPASITLWNSRDRLMALGEVEPAAAGVIAIELIVRIGLEVAAIYVLIGILDWFWQRYRFEKSIRMTKQEVKQEMRQQDISPELKAAQRRRQREAARRRMLQDVADADVIITNPTHYSVALTYDSELGAPKVVAKGVDLLALRIRELAAEAGVTRVENVPLARELYARVEVGQFIPADMFATVAEVLAYVYRLERRAPRAQTATPAT